MSKVYGVRPIHTTPAFVENAEGALILADFYANQKKFLVEVQSYESVTELPAASLFSTKDRFYLSRQEAPKGQKLEGYVLTNHFFVSSADFRRKIENERFLLELLVEKFIDDNGIDEFIELLEENDYNDDEIAELELNLLGFDLDQ